MEFGRHIGKGLWAFADKALPAIYGLGFIFLVIRVLPPAEYGSFVLIQTIVMFSGNLCYALALQPFTKYAAETKDSGRYATVSLLFSVAFYLSISFIVVVFRPFLVPLLDPGHESSVHLLLLYIPFLFLASFFRNFAISFLQARYRVERIFWIDAAYFGGSLILIRLASAMNRFATAEDLIRLTLAAYAASTIVAWFLTRRELSVGGRPDGAAIREMWNYGKFTFGATVSYNLFAQADVFFVSSFVGIAGVATYNAAKILTRLYDMLVQVIQMFLLPASSRLFAEGKMDQLRTITEKTIMFSLLLLLPVFAAMLFFPHLILALLYKGKYLDGAPVMAVYAFLAFVIPWNAVAGSIIQGVGRVKFGFTMGAALLVLAALSFSLLTPAYGMVGAAMAYLVTMSIVTAIITLYTRRLVHFRVGGILSRIGDARNFLSRRLPI